MMSELHKGEKLELRKMRSGKEDNVSVCNIKANKAVQGLRSIINSTDLSFFHTPAS
jgi:hypothetical protein